MKSASYAAHRCEYVTMQILRLFAALLLFASQNVFALSIHFDFAERVRSSAVVAWVVVERAELASGPNCGAQYAARVVGSIKGASVGDRIEFGYLLGPAIGKQYVVFLDEVAKVVRRTAGAEPTAYGTLGRYLRGCAQELPRYIDTVEGVGIIPVSPGEHLSYRLAVSLQSSPYILPMQLVGSNPRKGTVIDGTLVGSVQIEVSLFVEYLRSLTIPTDPSR